jgi:hypothetical protein
MIKIAIILNLFLKVPFIHKGDEQMAKQNVLVDAQLMKYLIGLEKDAKHRKVLEDEFEKAVQSGGNALVYSVTMGQGYGAQYQVWPQVTAATGLLQVFGFDFTIEDKDGNILEGPPEGDFRHYEVTVRF